MERTTVSNAERELAGQVGFCDLKQEVHGRLVENHGRME
jgi:hypothetical protein